MRLDVLLLPSELLARPRPESFAVVVDVIRATTSVVSAFRHGCRSILPVSSPEEARAKLAASPGAVLAGEQGGRRIPGFALGNSPREFARVPVAGQDVILTTSNGTKALRAVGAGRTVAIGAFPNRAAVGAWLAARRADALIVCSGYEGLFSLEDAVCAGAIVDRAIRLAGQLHLGDGARACLTLWGRYGSDLRQLLRETDWGRRIVELGLGEDLDICAALDVTDVVPQMVEGRITLAPDHTPAGGREIREPNTGSSPLG
ncbi:MAG TPA: 2-phosphosulfolactate phosphatase [Candidatus Methylomirabilis sp.]|nr:2-phosphosulfolactate phosphatase [Candidatus Methylomirabilis sp.]